MPGLSLSKKADMEEKLSDSPSNIIWDAIVIGGGPAGACAAAKLAQMGRSVLVIEKEKFPRFHVGESLLPYSRPILEEIGVWEKLQNVGFMRKRGAQFWLGNGTHHIRVTFAQSIFTEFPEALHVERSLFDQILLEHARASGAEICEETLVTNFTVKNDFVEVTARRADGGEFTERARFLVDASGLSNFTGNQQRLRQIMPEHRKIAFYAHFNNTVMPPGEEAGDILILRRPDSWCWMIPLSVDKTSVGLVFDADEIRAHPMPAEDRVAQTIVATPELQRRLGKAERITPVHVAADFSYHNRRLASPRLIRIGDASGFIDPIFSSGVHLALQSGRDSALLINEAVTQNTGWTHGMKKYETQTRRRIDIYQRFITKFYTREFCEVFMNGGHAEKITSAVNAVLAGRTELPFAAWWRLNLFFLIVRVQRHFTLAPRLAWE